MLGRDGIDETQLPRAPVRGCRGNDAHPRATAVARVVASHADGLECSGIGNDMNR